MKVKVVGMPNLGTKKVRITGVPKHQAGGEIPTTHGLPDSLHHLANIEAEGGEVYENQSGGFTKIADQAPSHEEGGVMIGDAKRVLEDTSTDRKDKHSKRLKMSPGEVDSIFGVKPKRPMSHAEVFEFVNAEYDKQRGKINKAQKNINETKLDNASSNSARLNLETRSSIPKKDDVFDTLFEHQEAIKAEHNIPNDGQAKYGGYKTSPKFLPKNQTGGLQPYAGGKPPEDITPTGNSNKFQYEGGLDAFKQAWKPLIDLDQYGTVKDAQAATYDWLVKNQPEVASSIWKEQGLTSKGLKMMNPKSKEYNPAFAKAAKGVFDMAGKVKEDAQFSPEVLGALSAAYGDNMLGIRSVTPSQMSQTDNPGAPPSFKPQAPALGDPYTPKEPNVNVNPRFIRQPANEFNEGTHWYDVAPAMSEYLSSLTRDAELYNPVQVHQLKYKLLNPTSAIRQNQSDYEAAIQSLGNERLGSGVRAANVAAASAQKYKANNQILAEYENRNAGIQNQEIAYNTQVRDRQSLEDAKSRQNFYDKVLQSRDNQRLQRLQAIQDLSRVQQLKARQNRSGNLILKMTPAFDQNGNYNGYQYLPVLPEGMDQGFIPQMPQKPTKPTSRTTTTFKVGDKVVKTTNSQ
jgi:hypothetical protein